MSKYVKGTFVLISGASKGIGKSIAIEFSKLLQVDCTIVLIARSEAGLEATKLEISKINPEIKVVTSSLDLASPDLNTYQQLFDKVLSNSLNTFENAIIFHNAGSIGQLNETTNLTDLTAWRSYFDLNLFSVSLLNSVFIEKMKGKAKKLTVVNITSLCGSKPFKNLCMYGSGKAARNMLFKVLAEEEPQINVLNYSPGPVDTDMVGEIITNVKDAEIKSMFTGLKEQKTILIAEQTVGKMIEILEKNDFKSGDIVDYYDRI